MAGIQKHKRYCDVSFDGETLNFFWNERAKKISENKFFDELKFLSAEILKARPKTIIGDIENLQEIVVGENMIKFMQIMVPTYQAVELKRLAVYTGEDLFKQLFVDQIFEAEKKVLKFKAKYFSKKEEMFKWIENTNE